MDLLLVHHTRMSSFVEVGHDPGGGDALTLSLAVAATRRHGGSHVVFGPTIPPGGVRGLGGQRARDYRSAGMRSVAASFPALTFYGSGEHLVDDDDGDDGDDGDNDEEEEEKEEDMAEKGMAGEEGDTATFSRRDAAHGQPDAAAAGAGAAGRRRRRERVHQSLDDVMLRAVGKADLVVWLCCRHLMWGYLPYVRPGALVMLVGPAQRASTASSASLSPRANMVFKLASMGFEEWPCPLASTSPAIQQDATTGTPHNAEACSQAQIAAFGAFRNANLLVLRRRRRPGLGYSNSSRNTAHTTTERTRYPAPTENNQGSGTTFVTPCDACVYVSGRAGTSVVPVVAAAHMHEGPLVAPSTSHAPAPTPVPASRSVPPVPAPASMAGEGAEDGAAEDGGALGHMVVNISLPVEVMTLWKPRFNVVVDDLYHYTLPVDGRSVVLSAAGSAGSAGRAGGRARSGGPAVSVGARGGDYMYSAFTATNMFPGSHSMDLFIEHAEHADTQNTQNTQITQNTWNMWNNTIQRRTNQYKGLQGESMAGGSAAGKRGKRGKSTARERRGNGG